VSSNADLPKDPPEALSAPEKPDSIEHYKVEDRIQAEETAIPSSSVEKVDEKLTLVPNETKQLNGGYQANSTIKSNDDGNEGSEIRVAVESKLSDVIDKKDDAAPSKEVTIAEAETNKDPPSEATTSAPPIKRHRTRSTSSAADKVEGKDDSQKELTSEAKESVATSSALDSSAGGKETASPKKTSGLAEEKNNEEAPAREKEAAVHPTRRHRTRSTSSAMSSISGDSHVPETTNYFDNDGKTPLIANRRSKRSSSVASQGPVRKRHKGRALFGGDSTLPNLSVEPSLFQDGMLNNESEDNVLVNLPRSRSNTIDSFRAAMDSTLGNEISESVVLPEMKTISLPEVTTTKSRSDTIDFMSKDILASPRARSDTIDFLTAAVGGDIDDDELEAPSSPIKISGDSFPAPGNVSIKGARTLTKGEIAFGKTPKKNNRSGEIVQKRDPIKKRYRTRSLSYAADTVGSSSQAGPKHTGELDEDDIATASLGSGARSRSNTFESFQNALDAGRSRSDTMDFLTAAVAGDMGHDLDAAMAAVIEGASFVAHPISAPSGASISHLSHQPSTRSRSNTLDSTTSSVNSSKLDFLISVAVEEGAEFGLLPEERIHDRTESASENSADLPRRPRSNTLEMYSNMAAGRGRSDTMDFLMGSGQDHAVGNLDDVILPEDDNTASGCVMDHLKALCGEPTVSSATKTTGILRRGRLSSGAGEASHSNTVTSPRAKFNEAITKRTRANSDNTNNSNSAGSSSQRLVMEALQHFEGDKQRDRNDSWGGMSDLSVTGIAATHDALKTTGIIDDIMAAAASIGDDATDGLSEEPKEQGQRKRTGSGGTNSLSGKGRPRLDSLASLSLASLSDASISVSGRKEQYASELVQKLPALETKTSTPSSQSIVVDYDAITAAVNAANAVTDGLDLNSILSSPSATKPTTPGGKPKKSVPLNAKKTPMTTAKKPAPKVAKPLPSAHKPTPSMMKTPLSKLGTRPTPKPSSMKPLPPKYQTTPTHLMKAPPPNSVSVAAQKAAAKRAAAAAQLAAQTQAGKAAGVTKPKLPVPSSIDIPIPKSTKTEEEMEAIRQRARAAAGYVPPGPGSVPPYKTGGMPLSGQVPPLKPGQLPPPRKPPMPYHPMPPLQHGHSSMPPKKRPNGPHPSFVSSLPAPPPGYMPRHHAVSRASSLQSQQKWDDMFEYLVKFIEETRLEQTKGLSEADKAAWVWDGNVPTNYKTKCGKALGRWINNQRTSKTKGTLKDDREVRLVSTGLKWSVLTTNSWNEMLHELEVYAAQKRQGGRSWDGNVPTNYKITVERTVHGRKTEEEKNLGRWVNRQRSLYQSGKLRPERQADLERVGLKWSVLCVASWSTMFEHLCKFVNAQRAHNNGKWDGDIPLNWRVEARPPVNLGRWVHRQRSAHAKGRLRPEFVMKLERTGLKWAMHDQGHEDEDFEGEEFLPKVVSSNPSIPKPVPYMHAKSGMPVAYSQRPNPVPMKVVSSTPPTNNLPAPAVPKKAPSPAVNTPPVAKTAGV
jgi:hypothetical protein